MSAQIAATTGGYPWDSDGSAPDVFVVVGCPGAPGYADTSGQTAAVESYTPTWSAGGCTARAADLLNRGFGFQLWDADLLSSEAVTAALTESALVQADFQTEYVDYGASGGMLSLRIALQRQ